MRVCIWGEAVMIGNGLTRPESCFPIWPYQPLPYFSQWRRKPLVFLVWSTKVYQVADLSLSRPQATFTNLYHRVEGDGDQTRSIRQSWTVEQAGPGLYTVRMVVHSGEHSRRVRTVVVGIEKKILKSSGRSACNFSPMVVKLVGQ